VNTSNEQQTFARHSIGVTLVYVFAPALFMLVTPYWLSALNPLGATIVSSAYFLTEAALLFGVIVFVARRESGTILSVIGYNRPLPILLFLILVAVGAAYAIYMRDFFSFPPLRAFSMSVMQSMQGWPSLFSRLPQHNAFFEGLGSAGRPVAIIIGAVSVGLASAMQTIYFRGFLLSRVDHWGILAPVAIWILFVVFHLGSPWMWGQFLLLTALWPFVAYFTKNVWAMVGAHVIMNTYGAFIAIGTMVAASPR